MSSKLLRAHNHSVHVVGRMVDKLIDKFSVSAKCALAIAQEQHRLTKPRQHNVVAVLNCLTDWRFDLEEVTEHTALLSRPVHTLDHHKHILEECGLPVTLTTLTSYLKLGRSYIFALKIHGHLDRSVDVLDRLCDCVQLEDAEDIRREFLSIRSADQQTLDEVRLIVFRRLLCRHLYCSRTAAGRMLDDYPGNRHRSLRLSRTTLEMAFSAGLTAQQIVERPCVLNSHPKSFRQLLAVDAHSVTSQSNAAADIDDISRPSLTSPQRTPASSVSTCCETAPWYNSVLVQKVLLEFGIDNIHHAELLSLSPDVIRHRLNTFKQDPLVWPLRHEPCFADLLIHFDRTRARLSRHRSLSSRHVSAASLSGGLAAFHRHLSADDVRRRGDDVVRFLAGEVRMQASDVRREVRLHPHWRSAALPDVAATVDRLMAAGYTRRQLRHALQVSLYPCELVMTAASSVRRCDSTDSCPEHLQLQLVLYRLEKSHYFSGTGVFAVSDASTSPANKSTNRRRPQTAANGKPRVTSVWPLPPSTRHGRPKS